MISCNDNAMCQGAGQYGGFRASLTDRRLTANAAPSSSTTRPDQRPLSMEMDSASRPGISLSVAGPPGGLLPTSNAERAQFQSSLVRFGLNQCYKVMALDYQLCFWQMLFQKPLYCVSDRTEIQAGSVEIPFLCTHIRVASWQLANVTF